jgi:hypothetical protein
MYGENRMHTQYLVDIPEEKKPLGRPKRRRQNGKMNILKSG